MMFSYEKLSRLFAGKAPLAADRSLRSSWAPQKIPRQRSACSKQVKSSPEIYGLTPDTQNDGALEHVFPASNMASFWVCML